MYNLNGKVALVTGAGGKMGSDVQLQPGWHRREPIWS